MQPKSVHFSTPTTKKEPRTISWNGTWPPETVFLVFVRSQKKGMYMSQDTSQDWREFKQVQITSVEGNNIAHW